MIAVDAATFAVLAVTYRLAIPRGGPPGEPGPAPARTAGFRVIRGDPALLGLLVLSFGFFLLFGPFYVAMPVLVTDDLHGSATTLGLYYTAFGVGALAGGLGTGYLSGWPLGPTTAGIVVGFGAALLPLGLGLPVGLSLPAFAVAGLVWAPYRSTSMALFQRRADAGRLTAALAAQSAITVLAVPLGTMLGGPLTSALGARRTLLACALATVVLGLVATVATVLRRRTAAPAAGDGCGVGKAEARVGGSG